jgi:hypothetical protein
VRSERVPLQGARARCARCDLLFTVGGPRHSKFEPFSPRVAVEAAPAPAPVPQAAVSTPRPEATASEPVKSDRQQAAEDRRQTAPTTMREEMGVEKGLGDGRRERHRRPPAAFLNAPEGPADSAVADVSRDSPVGIRLDADGVRQLAQELVEVLAATYPDRVAQARRHGRWEAHLGEIVREAWADFRSSVPSGQTDADAHFRSALNDILCEGRQVF